MNSIFKKDINGVRNLSDLSGEDAISTVDNPGNPLNEIMQSTKVQIQYRINNYKRDFIEDYYRRNNIPEEDFRATEGDAIDEFNFFIKNNPLQFIKETEMLDIVDWDGIGKGFDAMAKGSEFKDVQLASDMLMKISGNTRNIFDYTIQSLKDSEDWNYGNIQNLTEFMQSKLQDAILKGKEEFLNTLPTSKQDELLEAGVIGLDQNAKFVVELPDVLKEQIIEQDFPISGL